MSQATHPTSHSTGIPAAALAHRSEAVLHGGLVLLFGALTALSAQVQIPFQPVPVTGQVLVVLLAGLLLGPRLGAASQMTYLMLGLLGAPVFAGGRGGFGVLLGPTGGYLLAYPLVALLVGSLSRGVSFFPRVLLSTMLGALVILLSGGLWLGLFAPVFAPDQVHGEGLSYGLSHGTLPFLLVDGLKAAVAALIGAPLLRGAIRGSSDR